MKWISQAIRENRTGLVSGSRIVMLVSGLTIAFCTLFLTIASVWRIELVPALTVFGGSLSALAGSGYVATKMMEAKKNDPDAR